MSMHCVFVLTVQPQAICLPAGHAKQPPHGDRPVGDHMKTATHDGASVGGVPGGHTGGTGGCRGKLGKPGSLHTVPALH